MTNASAQLTAILARPSTEPSTLDRCATCTWVDAHAEGTYWAINGTNHVLCNGHAAELEARDLGTTFKAITPEAALYCTTGILG